MTRAIAFLLLFAVLLSCGPDTDFAPSPSPELRLLCDNNSPRVSQPRGVSLVFSARNADGTPLVGLSDNQVVYDDGQVVSELEGAFAGLVRPQNLRLRALLLVDGSGSVHEQSDELRTAVLQFVETFFSRNSVGSSPNFVRRELAVYKFFGDREIEQVVDYTRFQDVVVRAVQRDANLTRPRASTALYDSIQQALQVAAASPPSEGAAFAATLNVVVLVTDGREQTYAGADARQARQNVLNAAREFRNNTTAQSNREFRSMLVIAVGAFCDEPEAVNAVDCMDEAFVLSLLDQNQQQLVRARSLNDFSAFGDAVNRTVGETLSFYQYNICSPRRRGTVNAQLRVSFPSGDRISLPFTYDASSLRDDTGSERCDPRDDDFPTCPWSFSNLSPPP